MRYKLTLCYPNVTKTIINIDEKEVEEIIKWVNSKSDKPFENESKNMKSILRKENINFIDIEEMNNKTQDKLDKLTQDILDNC